MVDLNRCRGCGRDLAVVRTVGRCNYLEECACGGSPASAGARPASLPPAAVVAVERDEPRGGGCLRCGGRCSAGEKTGARARFTCKACGFAWVDYTKATVEAAKAAGEPLTAYAARVEKAVQEERARIVAELRR